MIPRESPNGAQLRRLFIDSDSVAAGFMATLSGTPRVAPPGNMLLLRTEPAHRAFLKPFGTRQKIKEPFSLESLSRFMLAAIFIPKNHEIKVNPEMHEVSQRSYYFFTFAFFCPSTTISERPPKTRMPLTSPEKTRSTQTAVQEKGEMEMFGAQPRWNGKSGTRLSVHL
ncbi:hypothetical protein AN963_12760 [Brevibacillus choshinensis]|uniref:Uncharacterized protein n=1 Tax=Brevibacillus choshinensis TaxID=54911 RepID=A0ABR5N5I0_BRECH|nr:hypothetical protein AN963_12760 [Brevibacillus choshinensis]